MCTVVGGNLPRVATYVVVSFHLDSSRVHLGEQKQYVLPVRSDLVKRLISEE